MKPSVPPRQIGMKERSNGPYSAPRAGKTGEVSGEPAKGRQPVSLRASRRNGRRSQRRSKGDREGTGRTLRDRLSLVAPSPASAVSPSSAHGPPQRCLRALVAPMKHSRRRASRRTGRVLSRERVDRRRAVEETTQEAKGRFEERTRGSRSGSPCWRARAARRPSRTRESLVGRTSCDLCMCSESAMGHEAVLCKAVEVGAARRLREGEEADRRTARVLRGNAGDAHILVCVLLPRRPSPFRGRRLEEVRRREARLLPPVHLVHLSCGNAASDEPGRVTCGRRRQRERL